MESPMVVFISLPGGFDFGIDGNETNGNHYYNGTMEAAMAMATRKKFARGYNMFHIHW